MYIKNFMNFYTCLVLGIMSLECDDFSVNNYPPIENRNVSYEQVQSYGSFANTSSFSKEIEDSLKTFLDTVIKEIPLCGVSIAAGVPDKGIWTAVRKSGADNVTIDSTTRFHAESTGKMFTATVILKLIEKNLITYDMTIDTWFSFIPKSEKITIRHLLMHTSGIPSFEVCPEYQGSSRNSKSYEPIEKVKWAVKYPYLFEPGASFSYSNTGYIILGLIAEEVAGKKFGVLLDEFIIKPLRLTNTAPITNENKDTVITISGHQNGKPIPIMEDFTGPAYAGIIASTPKDIMIFLQALMSGTILSTSSVQDMFTNMSRWPEVQDPLYYGKGIMAIFDAAATDDSPELFIEHNGGSGFMGFFCYPLYIPQYNLFVCVMTNDSNEMAAAIKFKIAEYLTKFI